MVHDVDFGDIEIGIADAEGVVGPVRDQAQATEPDAGGKLVRRGVLVGGPKRKNMPSPLRSWAWSIRLTYCRGAFPR